MKWLIGIIVVILLAAGGYFYLQKTPGTGVSTSPNLVETQQAATPISGRLTPGHSDTANYSDSNFHFSLSYPKSLEMHVYAEGDASRTVAFEGASPGVGFQVFIVPYTQNAITAERFKTDDPSGVMKSPTNVTIDGTPAKIFYGHNDQMGDTREVWFIHGGYLYEVTTYKPLDDWLSGIMQTWKFI